MKNIAIILFLLVSTLGYSQNISDRLQEIEKKVGAIKEINDIDAADLEIEIINTLDLLNEWQSKLIDELRLKTVELQLDTDLTEADAAIRDFLNGGVDNGIKVKDLRAYAVRFHGLSEDRAKSMSKAELIKLLKI